MNPILQPAYKRINCFQTAAICAVRHFTCIPIAFGTTGQQTGLVLLMSYDILKAHGGALKLETKEGGGTEFIIELPTI